MVIQVVIITIKNTLLNGIEESVAEEFSGEWLGKGISRYIQIDTGSHPAYHAGRGRLWPVAGAIYPALLAFFG